MSGFNVQKGVVPMLVILAVAVFLGLGLHALLTQKGPVPGSTLQVVSPSGAGDTVSTDVASDTPVHFNGQVLAGLSAPLLVYNDDDYQLAIKANKKILVHFCANWDPICKSEFIRMKAAFNDMRTDRVVGFYVHFNDNEMGAMEQRIASRLGVHTQNTKVIIENGQRVTISSESWDKARYIDEITKVLQ